MLAHHEVIVVPQAGDYVRPSGFAAMIAARWYALTRRTTNFAPTVPTHGES